VFHRVKNPMKLSSSRYFLLAERLPAYEGAVRAALRAKAPAPPEHVPVAPGSGGGLPRVVDDVRTVAAMSSSSEFPGIEYSGG
jgi:hypothetical protein